jgi:uncharacterized protein YhaN
MPAKTPVKKTTPSQKTAARKAPPKHQDGAPAAAKAAPAASLFHPGYSAETEALRAEAARLQAKIRETTERSAALAKELAGARASGAKTATLEQQLRESQARLTTQRAELEAARVELQNLRDEVVKARSVPPPPRTGCPNCGNIMADYPLDHVKARRCESCHGIFLENGALDAMLKHQSEHLQAGRRHWYSGLFGRK